MARFFASRFWSARFWRARFWHGEAAAAETQVCFTTQTYRAIDFDACTQPGILSTTSTSRAIDLTTETGCC